MEGILTIKFVANLYLWILVYGLVVFFVQRFGGEQKYSLTVFCSVLLICYFSYVFATRDLSIGIDTRNYKAVFERLQVNNFSRFEDKDSLLFYVLAFLVSRVGDFRMFLFIISVIYMYFPLWASRRFFGEKFFIGFFVFLMSPYFAQFGINVIRNGAAASVMLLAISYKELSIRNCLLVSSCLMHTSMLLPVSVFLFIYKYTRLELTMVVWLVVLCLSLAGFRFFNIFDFIQSFNHNYKGIIVEGTGSFSAFWIYCFPIVMLGFFSYYYLDGLEQRVFSSYFISSLFMLLTINVHILNTRYAYLSGSLLPIILPILLFKWVDDNKVLHVLFFLYALFIIKAYKVLLLML